MSDDYDSLKAQRIEIERRDFDNLEKYKTIMMAAAVEIKEHWEAHCDADGYGPVNLLHRLESGLHGGGYAYTAEDWVRCQSYIAELKATLAARDAKLRELVQDWRNVAAEKRKADEMRHARMMKIDCEVMSDLASELEALIGGE